jgi:hypothetical protein
MWPTVWGLAPQEEGMIKSDGIFWCTPAEFCWRGSFAGATFISKTAPAKFKMRQQNFRRASKIINPNDFSDMPRKKKGIVEYVRLFE